MMSLFGIDITPSFPKRAVHRSGFELTYRILQFAIHLRELAIRKNLNKIAIQKIVGKRKLMGENYC